MSTTAISCRRGSSLLQSRCSSIIINRNYSSRLHDHATTIPSSSSISSFLGLSKYSNRRGQIRHMSQLAKANGKKTLVVDTLALVRKLEAHGVPTKQAEAITAAVTEVSNDTLENVAQSLCTKGEMEKLEMVLKGQMEKSDMTQNANLSKFKSEVQSSQEHHFSLLQRENDKLRDDMEKMRNDFRHEIDKVNAGQRLDLNLERGRVRDEIAKQGSEISEVHNKIDKVTHESKAQLEAAKLDLIKYGIGAVLSITAVGLGIYRSLFQR